MWCSGDRLPPGGDRRFYGSGPQATRPGVDLETGPGSGFQHHGQRSAAERRFCLAAAAFSVSIKLNRECFSSESDGFSISEELVVVVEG